jgi:U-box domain
MRAGICILPTTQATMRPDKSRSGNGAPGLRVHQVAPAGHMKDEQDSICETHTVINSEGTTVFVPHDFVCPITLELIETPILTKYGHTFERSALLGWMRASEGNSTCPLTRLPLSACDLVYHHVLQSKINQWKAMNSVNKRNSGQPLPSFKGASHETACGLQGLNDLHKVLADLIDRYEEITKEY